MAEQVLISALEHYSYCPRQCALIHIESVWDENVYTTRGRHVHEGVDEETSHFLEGVRFERALPIWSRRLNLVGKADLVEFPDGVPYPVEYKSGKARRGRHEELQLCAQAVCLEEMFGIAVNRGALFWHGSRKRQEVLITDELRGRLEDLIPALSDLIEKCFVPPPVNDARCPECSLLESCIPAVVAEKQRVTQALVKLFALDD